MSSPPAPCAGPRPAAQSTELQRRLCAAVERMPAFPQSVQKILELTRNIDCLPKHLVAVIEKDPVMTMKILRVVNSAYYSLPSRINSVNQSVVYLGLNTVKNLALSIAAVGMLPRFNGSGFDSQGYLLHSLTTAGVARRLAAMHGGVDAADAYIAGLLHDFGKAVFAQSMPEEFAAALAAAREGAVPLHLAERETIGADHALVGAMLAQRWQLPEALAACIREHHEPAAEATPLLDCVRLADGICRKLAFGDSGNAWREEEAAAAPARFGALDAVVAILGEPQDIVAEARLFAQVRE